MSDKELMDFSFDIRRQPEYTTGEIICMTAQRIGEWILMVISLITFAFVFWQIFEALFESDEVCQCDHNLDDYY